MKRGYDLITAITSEVATYEGASPEILPELETWVSSEIVEELSTARNDRTRSLEFAYLWYRVTVHPDGEITVTP